MPRNAMAHKTKSNGSSFSDLDSSVIDSDEEIEYTQQHADILANEHFRQIDVAYHAEASASESESDSDLETDNITFPEPGPMCQSIPHTITAPIQMSPCYTHRERRKNLAQISRTSSISAMPTSTPEPPGITCHFSEDLHETVRWQGLHRLTFIQEQDRVGRHWGCTSIGHIRYKAHPRCKDQ